MKTLRNNTEAPLSKPGRPQRPQVTDIAVSSVRKVITWGRVRVVAGPGEDHGQTIPMHCFLCDAEWTQHWRRDGTPIYTGGLLTAYVRDKNHDRKVRREQACICSAGRRMSEQGIAPATARTIRVWKRLRNIRELATARMIIDAARPVL